MYFRLESDPRLPINMVPRADHVRRFREQWDEFTNAVAGWGAWGTALPDMNGDFRRLCAAATSNDGTARRSTAMAISMMWSGPSRIQLMPKQVRRVLFMDNRAIGVRFHGVIESFSATTNRQFWRVAQPEAVDAVWRWAWCASATTWHP